MSDRRSGDGGGVPLPIQLFLWRQTSPFIRPKLGKLHEATCVEMKEASKCLEKVLVQNILFGLSPSLTDAIKSISRWRLIQTAFPYVVHCAASLLHNRRESNLQGLGAVDTKLLYTLHWILLDAAEECRDADLELGIINSSPFHYLFPITSIQAFIYLFTPLMHSLKESDFATNFRLENGLKIWSALWEYRHPEVACFTATARPRPAVPPPRRGKRAAQQFGDVFMGGGKQGRDAAAGIGEDGLSRGPPTTDEGSDAALPAGWSARHEPPTDLNFSSEPPPAAKETSRSGGSGGSATPRESHATSFPETIPEETSSIEEEHVMIFRLDSLPEEEDEAQRRPKVYKVPSRMLSRQVSESRTSSQEPFRPVERGSIEQVESASSRASHNPAAVVDLTLATFTDVAVMRCLFIPQWVEEGVFWAVQFLFYRLREMTNDGTEEDAPRKRSNSLPVPKIEVSLYQSPETKRREAATRDAPPPSPEPKYSGEFMASPSGGPLHKRPVRSASERSRKGKTRMADFRAFVETKLKSRSSTMLEKLAGDERRGSASANYPNSTSQCDLNEPESRARSSMDQHREHGGSFSAADSHQYDSILGQNLVKGKSMPSLRYMGVPQMTQPPKTLASRISSVPHPIITVTQHTPSPTPTPSASEEASGGARPFLRDLSRRPGSLNRSYSDSDVSYSAEELTEAAGSTYYINKHGGIDLVMLLKGLHSVVLRNRQTNTLRVTEATVSLLEIMLSMDIMLLEREEERPEAPATAAAGEEAPETERSRPCFLVHYLYMDILVRSFKHMGCPNGCREGFRGPSAEFLRSQAQLLLTRLLKIDERSFKKYMRDLSSQSSIHEQMEFLHSFVGWCGDHGQAASPMNQKRSAGKQADGGHQFGYASNFGAVRGTASVRGVEGQMIGIMFGEYMRRLVLMSRELRQPENLALYHDVRQFVVYVRDNHGCIFRRVLLAGFLDSTDRKNIQNTIITTKVVRRVHTMTEPGSRESPTNYYHMEDRDDREERGHKKSFFRKKGTVASLSSVIRKAPSVQSMLDADGDESPPGPSPASTIRRKNRHSTRTTDEARSRRVSRFAAANIASDVGRRSSLFRREGTSRQGSEDSTEEGEGSDRSSRRQSVYRAMRYNRGGTVSLSLYRARKRMEDQLSRLGLGRSRRKEGLHEDVPDRSRHNSWDFDGYPQSLEYMIVKECRLVNTTVVRNGMKILNLLMESVPPGSVPDAPMVAAAFTLPGVPVATRTCFYLECAHFVHRCNKGQWPAWMKLNLPLFRSSGPLHNKPVTGAKRTHVLQRAAGKLFYQWAEALGARLDVILSEGKRQGEGGSGGGDGRRQTENPPLDDARKRQLRLDDDEEDFLDEASVNPTGKECPMALRFACCVLLYEITAFMRETYPLLPRTFQPPQRERAPSMLGGSLGVPAGSRRWSTALSSMGYSQTSAQSLQSISGEHAPINTERKISFVLQEPDDVSLCSSQNTIIQEDCSRSSRIAAGARSHLLKRSGGTSFFNSSFRRRSIKLRKGGKEREPDAESIKRADSIKSRRKVSAISDCSGTSDQHSGEESPGMLSDEHLADTPSDADTDDFSVPELLPWVRVATEMVTGLNYSCRHQQFCQPNCYKRLMRACNRLIKAVKTVYDEDVSTSPSTEHSKGSSRQSSHRDHSRLKRTDANAQGSPTKRKESVGRRDRVDRAEGSSGRPNTGSLHFSRETLDSDVERGGADTSSVSGPDRRAPKEEPPIVKYITSQVHTLFHIPLNLLAKSAVVLSEDALLKVLPVTWHLLLDTDHEVASAAATLCILAAVKIPGFATDILMRHLQHEDPTERVNAILRFQALWRFRYQCWPRMEDTAHLGFKVPPPGIEFTLPSPKIGIEALPVVDPSWMPQVKSKVEDVTLKEELHSIVSAGKTRRKQQAELVQIALKKEEEKKRLDRENYRISTVPVTGQAAHEPSFYHVAGDEHDEGNFELRTSAPGNRNSEANFDHIMRFYQHCYQIGAADEEPTDVLRGAHTQSAPQMFPSCLCTAATSIIALLDDTAVTPDGMAVYCVAQRVIWKCLVEDSALFLRHFLEKLTRERQEVMLQYLRRLIHTFPMLPAQTAFALYNYLVGYIMFQIRSNSEFATQNIANSLTVLWQVIPGIQGILFKDLKQIFRKEQCDATLMLTANVPSAKRIIVHGPQGPDAGGIPSQFPIQEDTQFCQILTEAREFFSIPEPEHKSYFLVDHKTGVIHNPKAYVRDFYFFKRSQYPQLSLIHVDPEEAYNAMQNNVFYLKLLEIGKTLKSLAMLMRPDQVAQRVFFLHEELTKLPAFPRKALETDFHLYKGGHLGNELKCLDSMHKLIWVKMMSRMFEGMAGNFAYSGDIHLFINVVNGCLLLHCEDSAMLRLVMATYISAAHQFKNVFSSNGYLLIMPTVLQVYSNHQSNSLLCRTVEFICKQFYVLHRKPFVLQMLGSIAPMLDLNTDQPFADANKIQPDTLFRLLISLETPSPDPLNCIELVSVEKPLRALDFCYHEETDDVTIMDVISLCVTVVAYAADSRRAHQMLNVLEAVIPFYLRHVERISSVATSAGPKAELKGEKEVIHQLALSIKTLLHNCEPLAKNYTGPTRGSTEFKTSSMKTFTRTAAQDAHNAALDLDEDSHSRMFVSEARRTNFMERDMEDSEVLREAFRRPRDTLLNIVADFLSRCSARLHELNKKPGAGGESKQVELLDAKCHSRLAEIAHSLLKVAPYDPETMSCRGLVKYMNQILTYPDWSQEALKPTLIIIMRRLEKVFTKILKKSFIRRHTDWVAAANLLKGVYTTLCKYPYIAHLPPLKALILVCQALVVGESGVTATTDGAAADAAAAVHYPPPQHFASTVVRLIAMQMLAQGEAHSLEQVCGGSSVFPSAERTEHMLMNLLLPLCLRVGCGRTDVPKMRQADISFALTVMLHALQPPASTKLTSSGAAGGGAVGASVANKTDAGLFSSSETRGHSTVRPSIYSVAFLGLKILLICFEKNLSMDWHRVARTVQELGQQGCGGLALWDFLDFVVTYPTPVFVLLLPFIEQHLETPTYDFADEVHFKQLIREKLAGNQEEMPRIKSKGSVLMELAHEMKLVKEEIANSKTGNFDHRKSVVVDLHSDFRSRLWTGSASDGPKSSKVSSQRSLQRDASVKSENWPQPAGQRTMRVYSMRSRGAVERFLRRTSYAGPEDRAGVCDSRAAASEPRLYRKSLFVMRKRGSRPNTADSDTTPGDSATDLDQAMSRGSAEEGLATTTRPHRHRLQRQKAQSRKTFRFRKSRRGNNFEMSAMDDQKSPTDEDPETGPEQTAAPDDDDDDDDDNAPCEIPETIDEVSLPLSPRPRPHPPVSESGSPITEQPAILSDVSPTSSSAAYRESLWLDEADLCQLQTLRESTPSQGSPGTTAAEVSSLPGDLSQASVSLGSDHTEHTALLNPAVAVIVAGGSATSLEPASDQNTFI